ncbi:thioredoxin domain-containing protein [Mycolicibacterium sp. CBM1]
MDSSRRRNIGKDVVFLAGLVIVAVALIVYLVLHSGDKPGPAASEPPSSPVASGTQGVPPPSATTAADLLAVERRQPNDPFALGNPAAPVVMVMFADYRCPFCAKFSRDTEPVLVKRFVDQGTLRIEWRDFPIFGAQSMTAARAGRAAAEQGRFWEFNRVVFAAAPEKGHADLTDDTLIHFAEQAGVPDIAAFTAGMRGTAYDSAINADLDQGNSIGVPSTPAFLINDVPMVGAQPVDEFVAAIDNAVPKR